MAPSNVHPTSQGLRMMGGCGAGIWGVVVPSHGAQLRSSAAQFGVGLTHLHPLLAALAVLFQWHNGNLPCCHVHNTTLQSLWASFPC